MSGRGLIIEAKRLLPIPVLWRKLALPGDAPRLGRKVPSPFRQDRSPSCVLYNGRDGEVRFADKSRGLDVDATGFLALATGMTHRGACARLIELAGVTAAMPQSRPKPAATASHRRQQPEFPKFRKGSGADFRRLARLRNLSVEGLQLASERGLLRFAELRGKDSWIVTDGEGVNAQARRLDGGTWEHLGGAKSWTLRGSWAGWPIGATESQAFPAIVLVEGGGDLLAAFHFAYCEDRQRDVAPVAMLGADLAIYGHALPLFADKVVRLFPHIDPAGQAAAERWTRQLSAVGADVVAFDFTGLLQTSGEPVGDLNDCSSICPDAFEDVRELSGMMP